MKRILSTLTLALVSTTLLTGTAHASAPLPKEPAAAAKKFLTAIEDLEGSKACSLMTKNYKTETVTGFIEAGLMEAGDGCPDAIKVIAGTLGEGGYGKMTSKTISVKGPKAKVKSSSTNYPVATIFTLRRVNGKWRVSGEV